MRITEVEYRRLRSFGHFENEMVGAVAALQGDETPEDALQALRQWVDDKLGSAEQDAATLERSWQLRSQVTELERRIENAKREYDAAIRVLKVHGIEQPEWAVALRQSGFTPDIPF